MPVADISSFNIRADLQSAPINPAWITEGRPTARSRAVGGSSDSSAWTMVWDCTAGEFDWVYKVDETIHVLEGQVTITVHGRTHTLGAGDIAFFPAGTVAHWRVENYVRKLAFCQKPMPAIFALPLRLTRRLMKQVAKGMALVEGSLGEPLPDEAASRQELVRTRAHLGS